MSNPKSRKTGFWLGALLASLGCRADDTGRAPPPRRPQAPDPAVVSVVADVPAPRHPHAQASIEVGFGDRILRTDVVSTFDGRASGYMGRVRVADDEALLFVYASKDARSFWMKNCLVALDILYLDDDGAVVDVLTAEPPESGTSDDDQRHYPSSAPVRLVLEVRAGLSREAGVTKGARVRLPAAVMALIAKAES